MFVVCMKFGFFQGRPQLGRLIIRHLLFVLDLKLWCCDGHRFLPNVNAATVRNCLLPRCGVEKMAIVMVVSLKIKAFALGWVAWPWMNLDSVWCSIIFVLWGVLRECHCLPEIINTTGSDDWFIVVLIRQWCWIDERCFCVAVVLVVVRYFSGVCDESLLVNFEINVPDTCSSLLLFAFPKLKNTNNFEIITKMTASTVFSLFGSFIEPVKTLNLP